MPSISIPALVAGIGSVATSVGAGAVALGTGALAAGSAIGSGALAGLTTGGLTGAVAGGLGGAGLSAGLSGALAPVLTDAALGAGMSAITGRNAGTGALVGGALGGLGELGSGSGAAGAGTSSAATVPGYTTAVPGPGGGADNSANGGMATTTNLQMPGFNLSMPTLPGSTPASPATTLPGSTGQVAGGTGNTLQQLSALGQILGYTKPATPSAGATYNQSLNPTGYINRTPMQGYQPSTGNWQTYGEAPEGNMFQGNQLNTQNFARGGGALSRRSTQSPVRGRMPSLGGRPFSTGSGEHLVRSDGDGISDSAPAKLSDGEYVLTAADVSRIGAGSTDAGARKLDEMRKRLARDAGAKQFQPRVKDPMHYLHHASRR